MGNAPCKDCERRTLTCHQVCREYKEWKTENDKRRQERKSKNLHTDRDAQPFWKEMNKKQRSKHHRRGGEE